MTKVLPFSYSKSTLLRSCLCWHFCLPLNDKRAQFFSFEQGMYFSENMVAWNPSLKEISDFSQLIAFLINDHCSPSPAPSNFSNSDNTARYTNATECPLQNREGRDHFRFFSTPRRLDPYIFRKTRKSIFSKKKKRATFPRELFFSSLWIWINLD